jgi:osmoprotectant transport system permease protein
MDVADQALGWLTDPAHWQGSDGVPIRLLEHVELSLAATMAAILIALPLGLAIGHTGRGGLLVVSIANLGRAIPSLALLVAFLPILGLGFRTTLVALILLAIPPIVTNAYAGIREVDRDLVEAARGMGMRPRQVLWQVELPAALPIILAGIRTAAVQVVATATLGAIIAGGGLGRYIVDGFALRDIGRIVGGATLVASLAIATELLFAGLERIVVSPGLRAERDAGRATRDGRSSLIDSAT